MCIHNEFFYFFFQRIWLLITSWSLNNTDDRGVSAETQYVRALVIYHLYTTSACVFGRCAFLFRSGVFRESRGFMRLLKTSGRARSPQDVPPSRLYPFRLLFSYVVNPHDDIFAGTRTPSVRCDIIIMRFLRVSRGAHGSLVDNSFS